jgi:hypothetical protein
MTLPAILPLGKGANGANIVSGLGALYPPDTFPTLWARGFRHIRIPTTMIGIVPGAGSTPVQIAAALARLDATVTQLAGIGFKIILAPFGGGALPNVPIIDQTLAILTARYAPMVGPSQLAFEIRNEPHEFTAAAWNAALPGLFATVRANAPLHTIIVSPVGYANQDNLPALVLPADPNKVVSVHFYQPANLTQQGYDGGPPNPLYVFPALPGTPGSSGLITIAKLNSLVAVSASWGAANNVPVMIGETGCPFDALTTTALVPGQARCVYVAAVLAAIELDGRFVGYAGWDVNSRGWGMRPHNTDVWNEPLLAAWDGVAVVVPPPPVADATLTSNMPTAMKSGQSVDVTFTVTNNASVLWYLDDMAVNDVSPGNLGANGIHIVPNPLSKNQTGWHGNPQAPMTANGGVQSWTVTFVAGPGPAPPGGVVNTFKIRANVELDHKATGRTVLTMVPTILVMP